MGGLALKKCFTKRISKPEYDVISVDIMDKLLTIFDKVGIPLFFKDKESFGDIDYVVSTKQPLQFDLRKWLLNNFDSKEIVQNTNVWSFEYKECQIDLIIMPISEFESCVKYMSYNDLGNLIGRLAHKFGTKYGQQGLVYTYRGNGKIIGEYSLTTDLNKICDFLGLDKNVYNNGFNSLGEIFDFIIASKYFNPSYYDMEELNRINRDRNKKRTTYQTFLNVCSELKKQDCWYQHDKDKYVYLGFIDTHFPGFLKWYRYMENEEKLNEESRQRFNGSMILSLLPTLIGKNLGTALNNFIEALGFETKKELRDFYLANTTVLSVC